MVVSSTVMAPNGSQSHTRRRIRRSTAALAAAAGIVLGWPTTAAAQTHIPVVRSMMSWVWWIAMMVCFMAVVTGGGWWGVSIWRKEYEGTDRALKILLGGIGGSVVVGGAAGIANATLGLSLHHFPTP